jgi:hypothetical protein
MIFKYTKTSRVPGYLFTLTNTPHGRFLWDEFRKGFEKLNPGMGGLSRLGRLRDRKSMPPGSIAHNGHVALQYCDRFDIYTGKSVWPDDYNTRIKLNKFMLSILNRLESNREEVEYVNPFYQSLIEVHSPAPSSITHIKPKPMTPTPKTSSWKCTVNFDRVTITGDGATNLQSHFNTLFPDSDAHVVKYEKLDEHQDLPLVQFVYEKESRMTYGSHRLSTRRVRVTKMDGDYIEGFEGNQFKKFIRGQASELEIIEIPAKKD